MKAVRILFVSIFFIALLCPILSFSIDKPKILSPNNDVVDNPVEFRWNKVTDAVEYKLTIQSVDQFKKFYIKIIRTIDTTVILSLPRGQIYYCYLTAYDSSNIRSNDNYISFTVQCSYDNKGAPILINPANFEKNLPLMPTFVFDSVCSKRYFMQIAYDSLFQNLTFNSSEIGINEVQLTSPLDYDTKYYWKVMSFNENGWSPWSQVFQFTTRNEKYSRQKPILIEPENGFTESPVCSLKLKWKYIPNIVSCKVLFSTDSSFSDIQSIMSVDILPIADSTFISGIDNCQKYFWKIQIVSTDDGPDTSGVWTFTTTCEDLPFMRFPKEGDSLEGDKIQFKWKSTKLTKEIIVHISSINSSVGFWYNEKYINSDTTVLIQDLEQGIKYNWYIKQSNAIDCLFKLQGKYFYIRPSPYGDPQCPSLIYPNKNDTVPLNPKFLWKSSKYATQYGIRIYNQDNYCFFEKTDIFDTTFIYENLLLRDSYYSISIRGENQGGQSFWGPATLFYTGKSVGINDLYNSQDFTINYISNNLILTSSLSQNSELYIYDLLGRILQKENLNLSEGENRIKLREDLPNYFICVVKCGNLQKTKLILR